MTETATPGPWAVEPYSSDYYYAGHWVSAGAAKVAECIESEADAFLIAAAPDLHEALKLAREYMRHCLGSRYEGPDPYPIIDAALAKATVAPAPVLGSAVGEKDSAP